MFSSKQLEQHPLKCSCFLGAFALGMILPSLLRAGDPYEKFFLEQTIRLDYYHHGTKNEESFSLDKISKEDPWAGSKVNLLDTLNLGEYLLRVFDQSTTELIYSRGFSTIFNEWQTTDEAASGVRKTFSESARFPCPKRTVQVTIARRDKQMVFHEIFSVSIDPNDPARVRKEKGEERDVSAVVENGPPEGKVDVVILGDGYTREELPKFRNDARRFSDALFMTEPFKSRRSDFNVWIVEVKSEETGVDIPDVDVWRRNALGTSYNTFGSARYVLSEENKALRDAAARAPYDFMCILVNDSRYGGGGIFNLYATTYTKEQTSAQEWQMDYVFVHEFGHSFAGLGDEYYSSSVAYNEFYPPGVEPWEPNITAMATRDKIKWRTALTSGIEIPTPWEKAEFDSIEVLRSKLDRLAPDYYEKREPLYRAAMTALRTSAYSGKVGAFEGAGYASRSLYRPSVDCRMFSLSLVDFDPVCAAAIIRMIDFYSK